MLDLFLIHTGIFSSTAFFLFIWFDTNAAIEYAKIFRLNWLFYIEEYEEVLEVTPEINYPLFAVSYKDSFINRALSCPFCLCTWIIFYYGLIFLFICGFKILGFIFLDWFAALALYKVSSGYFLK